MKSFTKLGSVFAMISLPSSVESRMRYLLVRYNELMKFIEPYFSILAQFLDLFSRRFINMYAPELGENKRQKYVLHKATSFLIWIVGVLVACEMVATYMKVSLSSILAFGGIGGLALGLSAKDIAGNFLGIWSRHTLVVTDVY